MHHGGDVDNARARAEKRRGRPFTGNKSVPYVLLGVSLTVREDCILTEAGFYAIIQ